MAKKKVVDVNPDEVPFTSSGDGDVNNGDTVTMRPGRKAKTRPRRRVAAPKPKKTAKASPKAKPKNECLCGCTRQVKGRFSQGHDARVNGWLLKVGRGEMKESELPAILREAVKKGLVRSHATSKKSAGSAPVLNSR